MHVKKISELLQNGLALHQAGRLQEAKTVYQSILQEQPQHPDVLHLLGVIAHQVGQNEIAVDLIEKAIRINPVVPDFYNNCGEVYRALHKNDLAIARYRKALALKPDDAETHNNLWAVLQELDRHKEANTQYEQALAIKPDYAEALYNLGISFCQQGRQKEGIIRFEQSLAIKPDDAVARYSLGVTLQELDRHKEAITQYEQALAIKPDYIEARNNMGNALQELGLLKDAIVCFEQVLAFQPDFAEAHYNLGITLQELGRQKEAITQYEQALAIKPDYVDAYCNIGEIYEKLNQANKANIYLQKAFQIQPNHTKSKILAAVLLKREGKYKEALEKLRAISHIKIGTKAEFIIHYDIGELFDLINDSDSAMHHFTEANRIQSDRHEGVEDNKNIYLNQVENITEHFTQEFVNSWHEISIDNEDNSNVFLMGFPGSGTTLLDQILDSHPGIQVIEERPLITNIVEELSGFTGGYPAALASLGRSDIHTLRKKYLTHTEKYIDKGSNSITIDKLPLNTIHIGLIYRLFPEAKIILALRHPYDVCLSNFMQKYKINRALENFFTIEDTAVLYDSVMGLWKKYVNLLPLDYIEVKYEYLVDDFELEVKRLLNFLEIDWDPLLLDYSNHAKNRVIQTPSYNQVTKPIYQTAKYRWQRYKEHIMPIMNRLEPHITYFHY